MNIVKYEATGNLPAYLTNGAANLDINNEVVRSAAFPSLSIKGKTFTVNRDGVKTILTKPGEDDEVAQSIGVVFLRANMNAKTFYAKKYSEGDSDGARPDCYSFDGVAPSPNSVDAQAKKCAICPHNQWGSRIGDGDGGEEKKGKACQDNARIAVSTPDTMDPMLLRVPPKSLKSLRDMLKGIKARKVPYNAVVVKIGFDREAPSPVLTFKPVGFMDDAGYATVNAQYDDEVVRAIVGVEDTGDQAPPVSPAPSISMDELDAAIAAREATRKAAATAAPAAKAPLVEDDLDDILPKAKPAPKLEAKPVKAEPKAKPAPKEYTNGGDEEETLPKAMTKAAPKTSSGASLLADLDDLLGNKDD
jgi:hypothetical protein